MAAKSPREEETRTQVLPRCLLIVFKERRSRKSGVGDVRGEGGGGGDAAAVSAGPGDNAASSSCRAPLSGRELFDNFQTQNKNCYWNPHLEESVKNLKYAGYLTPGTLLVHGRDIYLDTVKGAWCRRVLRAPCTHHIARVGEIESLEMTVIPQTQFTPLPEALCIVISELAQDSRQPSLDAILTRLQDKYRGMQQPSEQIVYETLGSLIKERKIYHTGNGYQIVTPESYQNGCLGFPDSAAAQILFGDAGGNGQMPAIYIPMFPGNKASEMCSVSCQTAFEAGKGDTEDKSEKGDTDKIVEDVKDVKPEKESKKSRLDRSHSMRGKSKERKEKADAFQRSASLRYGEDKSREMVKDINLKTSNVHQDKDKGEKQSLFTKLFGRKDKGDKSEQANLKMRGAAIEEQKEKEYATFSAQFPPPEWNWYENQVSHILRPRHVPRSQTWHPQAPPQMYEINSDPEDEPMSHVRSKVRTLPVGLGGHPRPRRHSISSQSQESRSSSKDSRHESPHTPVQPVQNGKHKKHRHKGESHRKSNQHQKQIQSQDLCGTPEQAWQHQDGRSNPGCSRQNHAGQGHKHHGYSPHDSPMQTSTPVNGYPQTPQTSQDDILNNGHVRDYGVDPSQPRQKYREVTCPGLYGDISMEYCGRLPNKGSMFSMSRDSGVNCVGLKDTGGCLQGRSYMQQSSSHPNNLTVLNNQTGTKSPKQGSNHNNLLVQAQIHPHSDPHQDSGFSSPRTDTDQFNTQIHSQSSHNKNVNLNNMHHSRPGYSKDTRTGQTNGKQPISMSAESIHITGSEKYPSYNQLAIDENEADITASSSSMSKNTVIDLFPTGHHLSKQTSKSRKDSPMRQVLVRKEPYVEIQLVADGAQSPADIAQRTKGSHGARQSSKDKKQSHRDKSCPVRSERTSRNHPTQVMPANGYHGHNTEPAHISQGQTSRTHHGQNGVHRKNQRDRLDGVGGREQQQYTSPHSTHPSKANRGSDPRLAYLGDVQVVGVV